MGKGSGGGSTDSTVTQTNLPEYARPYFENLLQRGQYESLRPYTPYGGQRIAEFTPRETLAMQGIENLFVHGTPQEIKYASALADPSRYTNTEFTQQFIPGSRTNGYVADPSAVEHGFNAGKMTDAGIMAEYMNPYQQNVIDIAVREANRRSEIEGDRIADQAAMAGGLGGYREAIMQSERQRNLQQQLDDIQYTGMKDAYDNAQRAFEIDRQARLARAGLDVETGRLGQELGQTQEQLEQAQFDLNQRYGLESGKYGLDVQRAQAGANQATRDMELASAEMLSGIGELRQAQDIERAMLLQAAGENERQMFQKSLDTGYGDFLTQLSYPREQLNFLSGILQGVPVQPGMTQSTFSPQASDWQQALGAGLGGVALYNAIA